MLWRTSRSEPRTPAGGPRLAAKLALAPVRPFLARQRRHPLVQTATWINDASSCSGDHLEMLIVHHLATSQSERVVLLCEELELQYELRRYERDPLTRLAPPEYKALHPLGAAPVIEDAGHVMAESGAIIEYVLGRYGSGRLRMAPEDVEYADYVYWYHFINGTLQAIMGRKMMLTRAGVDTDHPVMAAVEDRLRLALGLTEARLTLVPHLAGEPFSAADVMIMFTLTTMRHFVTLDLEPFPSIRSYIGRIADRPAYQRAMQKCDPDLKLVLS